MTFHAPDTPLDDREQRLVYPGVLRPFVLVTALFFLWGIPNNLNDVLIRQFMKSFAISRFQAGLVQSAFYLGYFMLALPAGMLIRRRGYKAALIAGLASFALGCFLFWPAALLGSYAFFLTALFIVACGLAFLETAANPLITQLGPPSTSERRLNLSQAFNPIGAITGVLFGTYFIFSGIELTPAQTRAMQAAGTYRIYLHHETLRVVLPYCMLGIIAVLWAAVIARTRFPAADGEHQDAPSDAGAQRPVSNRQATPASDGASAWTHLLRQPSLLYAVLAQFLYVGAQVGTWSYFIPYAQEYTHVSERLAGLLLTSTLAAFCIGRFASAYAMRWFTPEKLMGLYSVVNLALLAVGILAPGWYGLLAILLTSFFMSIMYPTIFAMGIRGMAGATSLAGSLLVMAVLGGAVLTPAMGFIAEKTHATAPAYLLPGVAYLVIAGFARYTWNRWKTA